MRVGFAGLVALCLLEFGRAQEPAPATVANNAPEVSTQNAAPTFSTRVNLVLIPVVIRDSQGRAVGTFKEDDFQLFDKGKPQLITRFTIERPARSPAGAASTGGAAAPHSTTPANPTDVSATTLLDHFVAYLFDDVHLNASDLLRMRSAAERHLSETLDPTRRVAIYSTSGRTMLDFTDDSDQLHKTLLKLQPLSDEENERRDCPPIGFFLADKIQNQFDTQALNAMIDETIRCLALDPTDPSSTDIAKAAVNAAVSRMLSVGPARSRLALTVLKDVIRRLSAVPGSRTVVLASPGFFLTSDMRSDETEVMDRAIRANVTISSLDARGLYTVIPGGDASQRGMASPLASAVVTMVENERMAADANIMAELADATGGTFFHNDNGLQEGLKQLAAQPEYLYILGFSPQNLKFDGSYHTVKITVKNSKGLAMQARRGYYAPNHAIDPEVEAKQEIQEAFFSREEMQEFPVDLQTQFFKSSDVNARLTVVAKVDVRQIHFQKVEDRNRNRLTIISGVFDRNGNYVTGIQQTVDMRLRDQTLAAAQTTGITVRSNLNLAPGTYMLRLVVRDSEGRQMAARNGVVEIPY